MLCCFPTPVNSKDSFKGEVSHEDDEPLKYGSNGTSKQGIEEPTSNGIDNSVTRVSYKKRTESESSVDGVEQNKPIERTVCDSITSSEPNAEPVVVPEITVNPSIEPYQAPKQSELHLKPESDSRSVISMKTASPNTKIRLLDLAEGRYSDSDFEDHKEDDDFRESCDSLDDLDGNRSRRKKGPLSSLLGGSRESMLSVYSDAGEVNYGQIPVTGEILFGLDFNSESGELRIDVQECKNIAAVDTKNKRSDPYVKAYLLPDKSRNGKRKTKIKKHTLSPVFNEVLKYNISESELYSRSLWLTVWHNDKFGRNDFLGEVLIQFENYKFSDNNSPRWYPLQERLLEEPVEDEGPPYKGDLVLSLSYVTPDSISQHPVVKKKKKKSGPSKGELRVMVKEAHNLTALHANGTSNPFCKGYLLPDSTKMTKQKTNVIKKNCSPVWNQVFLFEDVGLDELPDKCLELTVWDHESLSSNDFLGGNRFNLGLGRCEGKEVDWMDARGEEILIWENVMENPNTWVDVTIALRATMGQNKVKK